jgi:hypothetical protein
MGSATKAITSGCLGPIALTTSSFDPYAGNAAANPAAHSFHACAIGRPVVPIRLFIALRRNANSTHPAIPADDVNPAVPHFGSIPKARGNGNANK